MPKVKSQKRNTKRPKEHLDQKVKREKPLISSFHLGTGLYYTNNVYEPDNFEFRLMQGLKFFLPSIEMIPLKNYIRLEERFQKTFDGYIKYRLLKQKTGESPFPVSLTVFGSAAVKTIKDYEPDEKPDFVDRMAYTTQILLARKFNQNFSLQVSQTHLDQSKLMLSHYYH